MGKPRQAVVLIHGIGEQRPMQTLRSFVLGIFGGEFDDDGKRRFYSKPDPNAEGFELRRYRAFDSDEDSDFIEFYWQHLMPIGSWAFILSWLWTLMVRPARLMPPRFLILWWVCWIVFAAIAIAALAKIVTILVGHPLPWLDLPTLGGGFALALGLAGTIVRGFVGDAAIYLNPSARTVESRNKIRASGVALLERLQADGRYDRIVIVGHSLGAVIGYDMLNFAWQRASEAFRRDVEAGRLPPHADPQTRLAAAEALAGGPPAELRAKWKEATRDLHFEQRRLGINWLVTDFITLGSPLAHAALLLAHGAADLERRIEERELPTAPPFREDGAHFSYERHGPGRARDRKRARVVDHAALFAVTAWTNLYFPCRWLFYGDLVGGEVGPLLGPAVVNIPVRTAVRGGWFAHTAYWTRFSRMSDDAAPRRLVEALDLARISLRRPKSAPAQISA